MKNRIKFIYFDIGGVLFDWRAAMTKIAEKLDVSLEQLKLVFHKFDDDACRGVITQKDLWLIYQKELKLKKALDFDIGQFWTDHFYQIPDSHQLLRDLSVKFPIGLLTNIYPGVFPKILDKGHIPNIHYKVILQSCDLGVIKPEKEIYQIAQIAARVKHEEILFLDDLEVNVQAAKKLGWQAFLVDKDKPQITTNSIRKMLLS